MTKYAILNTCDWGSTGKIAQGLLSYLLNHGEEAIFCYGRGSVPSNNNYYRICNKVELGFNYLKSKFSGKQNDALSNSTERLISRLRSSKVKHIFIINLHGYYINETVLFDYLIKDQINVVYIMADESAFLGNCEYRNECKKYLDGCKGCKKVNTIARHLSPTVSERSFQLKAAAYEKMTNITFVGPQYVINSAVTSPLLYGKTTAVVDEAIDVSVNVPKDSSRLRSELGIDDQKIVIGCVAPFSFKRKGVRFLIEAAKRLEHNDRFVFVQVGYDSKDTSELPRNYIPIGYVNNQDLLTEYYSLADLFVFPSLLDTMPNACLEALACGSPLLCFNISGMPYIADESVMTLVEAENVDQMVEVILQTKKKTSDVINVCRNYALNRYDNQKYFAKLVEIMNQYK